MVQCDECDRWFRLTCAKSMKLPTPEEDFFCIKCTANQSKKAPLPARGLSKPGTSDPTSNAILELVAELRFGNTFGASQLKRMALNDIPYFDGNQKDWPAFDKAFKKTTEEGGFSNLKNINRLQKCLKGNALKSV